MCSLFFMLTGKVKVSSAQVWNLFLERQGFAGTCMQSTKENVLLTVRRLGILQLDAVRAVERAQYLTLYSRIGYYDKTWLDHLAYQDRLLVEHWAHCASLIPTADIGRFYPVFELELERGLSSREMALFGSDPEELLNRVLEFVESNGQTTPDKWSCLMLAKKPKQDWWGRSPAKIFFIPFGFEF